MSISNCWLNHTEARKDVELLKWLLFCYLTMDLHDRVMYFFKGSSELVKIKVTSIDETKRDIIQRNSLISVDLSLNWKCLNSTDINSPPSNHYTSYNVALMVMGILIVVILFEILYCKCATLYRGKKSFSLCTARNQSPWPGQCTYFGAMT